MNSPFLVMKVSAAYGILSFITSRTNRVTNPYSKLVPFSPYFHTSLKTNFNLTFKYKRFISSVSSDQIFVCISHVSMLITHHHCCLNRRNKISEKLKLRSPLINQLSLPYLFVLYELKIFFSTSIFQSPSTCIFLLSWQITVPTKIKIWLFCGATV
jgi:hypothetical protein